MHKEATACAPFVLIRLQQTSGCLSPVSSQAYSSSGSEDALLTLFKGNDLAAGKATSPPSGKCSEEPISPSLFLSSLSNSCDAIWQLWLLSRPRHCRVLTDRCALHKSRPSIDSQAGLGAQRRRWRQRVGPTWFGIAPRACTTLNKPLLLLLLLPRSLTQYTLSRANTHPFINSLPLRARPNLSSMRAPVPRTT